MAVGERKPLFRHEKSSAAANFALLRAFLPILRNLETAEVAAEKVLERIPFVKVLFNNRYIFRNDDGEHCRVGFLDHINNERFLRDDAHSFFFHFISRRRRLRLCKELRREVVEYFSALPPHKGTRRAEHDKRSRKRCGEMEKYFLFVFSEHYIKV